MRKFLLISCVGAAAFFANGAVFANDELIQLSKDPKQWVMPTGDYANRRFSNLDQINSDNVKHLTPVWSFSTGVLRGHEGGPLVIGHVMYFTTPFPNIVYALDLNHDGKILWKYEPKQDPNVIPVMCCDTVNRGVAYGDGKIFLHQADTTLVALEAKTGAVVWSVKNGDPSRGETGTSAPQVVKDKVLVGISGGEFGVRGSITAYNIKTGKKVWRGYSMGPDSDTLIDPVNTTSLGKPVGPDSGTNTWKGDQWKIGGGTTWGWISFDPELNLVYYGSGNPSTWNAKQRPGDNRWSMTIWARDADTGVAKWVYQLTPHDEWDYDAINEMILANQEIRKVLVHFDRNGFGYTLDRVTGEPLVAEKFDPAVNWASKVDLDKSSRTYGRPLVAKQYSTEASGEDSNTQGICPAALGSKDEQPAAYSPETGLFYIPANHVCMDYEPFHVSYTAGQPYVGATLSMYPPKGESNMGNFTAWDAKTGKIVWQKKELFSVWSGALATAGNLVFYGTLEGYLKAVDAGTGEELYKFKTPSGIIGNVMTYEHNGKQYVAVLSGVGGWAGIGIAAGLTRGTEGLGAVGGYAALSNYTALGGQLTVFALSGLPGDSSTTLAELKVPRPSGDSRTLDIFYATNRLVDQSGPRLEYTGGRADELSFGMARVRVPDNHREGAVERPWRINVLTFEIGQSEDPKNHFILRGLRELDREAFIDTIRDSHRDTALVFIHGYNNSFEDGVFRLAQIVGDGQLFDIVPVLFSWPSKASAMDYVYDEGSSELSIESFLDLLKILQTQSGIKTVHIVAHSMGNRIVLNALAAADTLKLRPFAEVVLAAPDVDRDVFIRRSQIIRKVITGGVTLYASAADKPLGLVGVAASVPRAGDVTENGPVVVEGVESIDMTAMGNDLFALNHSTFATSPVVEDIARLVITSKHPPNLRTSRIRGVPERAASPRYWRYSN